MSSPSVRESLADPVRAAASRDPPGASDPDGPPAAAAEAVQATAIRAAAPAATRIRAEADDVRLITGPSSWMTPVSCGRLSSVPWLTEHHIARRADVLLPHPAHTGDRHAPAGVYLHAPWVSPLQRYLGRSRRSPADHRDHCRPRELAGQGLQDGT